MALPNHLYELAIQQGKTRDQLIMETLQETGSTTKAAERLGISRQGVYLHIQRIKREAEKQVASGK